MVKLKLIISIFLIIFSHNTLVFSETKSKKRGIGIRYGSYTDSSSFKASADRGGDTYISYNSEVNNKAYPRSPIAIQFFEESLINNWSFKKSYFSYDKLFVKDMPPVLKDENYKELIEDSIDLSDQVNILLKADQTLTSTFTLNFPEYEAKINSFSEPSLSVDYEIVNITLGYQYGIFIPQSERHRWLSAALGLGLGHSYGKYSVNICDPYIIVGGKIIPDYWGPFSFRPYRNGICSNKSELYSKTISNFGLSISAMISIYSYVGENFEISLWGGEIYQSALSADSLTTEENPSILIPTLSVMYAEVASLLYVF